MLRRSAALGGEGREGGKRGEGAVCVVGGDEQWNTILLLYGRCGGCG